MKLNKIILAVCLVFCSIGLLSGCVMLSKERMSDGSTDYNKVVEKAQNQMLLLNIIRSSKRSPMYFTDFNAMRGSMTYNIQTGSIMLPFGQIGAGLDGSYSVAPSTSFTTNPNFDLTVNNSQDFTKGIMTPIDMNMFNYYWEQGWPKEMLLHLFIRRIEKIGSDGKVIKSGEKKSTALEFTNEPDNKDKDEFTEFQRRLRNLFTDKKCTIVSETQTDKIGPEISEEKAADLKNLIKLQAAGLKLQEVEKKKFRLIAEKVTYKFDCGKEGSILTSSTVPHVHINDSKPSSVPDFRLEEFKESWELYTIEDLANELIKFKLLGNNNQSVTVDDLNKLLREEDLYKKITSKKSSQEPSEGLIKLKKTYNETNKENDRIKLNRMAVEEFFPDKTPMSNPTYRIYLRSPEAILYYLGEIVRAETEQKKFVPTIKVCPDKQAAEVPLFVVNKTTDNVSHYVKVDYEGDQYVIPQTSATVTDSCLADRSMHVLSLLSQLIGLQKKGEKTPVTGVVTFTGGR